MSDQKKPKKQEQGDKAAGPNGWSFAIEVTRGFFGLLNTGRIFPAFMLLIIAIMGLVAWRLPESELASVVIAFFDAMSSSSAIALTLLLASNVGWFALFNRQKRMYERELERMAEIRSKLFHLGVQQVLIKDHRSSTDEQSECYILPDLAKEREKGKL